MKNLLIVIILLAAMLTPTITRAQTDDADCNAYLEMRQADVDLIEAEFANLDTENLGDTIVLLYTTRYKYEDMQDVPECAENLHRLFINLMAANQDVMSLLILGIFDEQGTMQLAAPIGERIDTLQSQIADELESLGVPQEQ